jgi:hypothetical protein
LVELVGLRVHGLPFLGTEQWDVILCGGVAGQQKSAKNRNDGFLHVSKSGYR